MLFFWFSLPKFQNSQNIKTTCLKMCFKQCQKLIVMSSLSVLCDGRSFTKNPTMFRTKAEHEWLHKETILGVFWICKSYKDISEYKI